MARKPAKFPVLKTPRLRLRPWRKTDLTVLHRLYGDAGNLRW